MRFRDLGPLLVEIDGADLPAGGRKPAAILGMLLVNANRRVSVEAVMEGVWGESVTDGTASTLESHIWRLRRVIEPNRGPREAPAVLINDNGGYRLLVTNDQVDSLRFEELAGEARDLLAAGQADRALRRCDEALALWRGRPYEAMPDAPWAEAAGGRLDEIHTQLRERRIDALLAEGDSDRALTDVDALIGELPFREHLWAQRMLALYRSGRSEEALQTYLRARTVLMDEMGIEPGQELQELQRKVLDQDEELAAPRTPISQTRPSVEIHLPTSVTPLIGRAEGLAQLTQLIATRRMVTVSGAAGSGKTRLAVEAARESAGAFADGVWFIDLGAVDEPDLVVDVVVSAIGIAPTAAGTSLDGLRAYSRDRRMLLLLDNCEHLLEIAATIAETVLGDDGESVVLTTSREPLGVDGEAIWTLGPLDLPPPDEGVDPAQALELISAAPAVELFVARITAADPLIELRDDDLRTIAHICVAVDGLPLAIELAAARIRSSTLAEIAEEVAHDASALSRIGRGPADHRQTVFAAIEWSHRLLSPEEQALHRRLSVLPGTFTRSAAVAVGGTPPVAAGEVPDLLAMLIHRSLLDSRRADRPGGPTLFRQLATVRGHAERALATAEETTSTLDRRDDWVRDLLERTPRMGYRDVDQWYDEVEDTFSIVRAALRRNLAEQPNASGVRMIGKLTLFWYFRSHMSEARRWHMLAREAHIADADPLDVAMLEFGSAGGVTILGRTDLAQRHTEAALSALDSVDVDSADRPQLIRVGDHIASLAISIAPLGATGVIAILEDRAKQLARVTADAGLAVLVDALACMAESTSTPPDELAARAEDIYRRGLETEHLMSSWIAASVRTAIATGTRDPVGRMWMARTFIQQLHGGGTYSGLYLEATANFSVLLDEPAEAARLYSASRAQARRSGTTWPRQRLTVSLIDQIQKELTRDAYDQAWREGAALTHEEIVAMAEANAGPA